MGTISITPQYTDYTASGGAAWSTLGADEANHRTIIANVCTALSTALSTNSGGPNISFKIDFGLNRKWNLIGPPDGTNGASLGSGAASNNAFFTENTYSNVKTALQAISGKNTIQTSAFGALPGSAPGGITGVSTSDILAWALGSPLLANHSFSNGDAAIGVGIALGNYDSSSLWGTDASKVNLFAGVLHECTEGLGRLCDASDTGTAVHLMDLFTFDAATGGSYSRLNTGNRFLSYDNGATSYYQLDNGGTWDRGDTVGTFDSFNSTISAGAASRSSSLPGLANNWINMTELGWGLTDFGLYYAGLGSQPSSLTLMPQIHM